jgi:cellulose synthase/poly-beta-1,6-N-acetylglucosamine synthase-like glycosyltransferase
MIGQTLIQLLLVSQILYLINLVVTNATSMVFIIFALPRVVINYFTERAGLIRNFIRSQTHLPVSILVPAYNEEKTITETVGALLNTDFGEYEILVINDGSSDRTLEVLKEAFQLYLAPTPSYLPLPHERIRHTYHSHLSDRLIVVDKENGGKADALNAGINLSRYPLFCSIDADTIPNRDAILKGAFHFSRDSRVIAVGGSINVINGSRIDSDLEIHLSVPKRMIERMQIIEYTRAFLAGRTFWSAINGMLIISGAFGIYRKKTVIAVRGYRKTIGEDLDLIIRMRRHCYEMGERHRVLFLPDIMCWTQAPSDYASLLTQRNRWQRGLIESLYHNRGMIFNPRYGAVGLVTLPYYLFVEALNPLITFLGSISIVLLYLAGLINQDTIILFFVLEFVWGMALNIFSFWLEIFVRNSYGTRRVFHLLWDSMLEPFYYKPMIKAEQLIATFTFMNSKWGQARRHKIEQRNEAESGQSGALQLERSPS